MLVTIEVEVPDWAKYLAQDQDGEWWVFNYEPYIDGDLWNQHKGKWKRIYSGRINPNWQQELYELIQE